MFLFDRNNIGSFLKIFFNLRESSESVRKSLENCQKISFFILGSPAFVVRNLPLYGRHGPRDVQILADDSLACYFYLFLGFT